MEVYQSSKTAAEMEFALGAIPSIGENNHWFIGDVDTGVSAEGLSPHVGENGNWWVGETDTGIYASGVMVEGAEVGQTIVVKAVDENGKPTEWEVADIPPDWEVIADITTTEEVADLVIDQDANGEAFDLDEIEVMVYAQNLSNAGNWYVYIGRSEVSTEAITQFTNLATNVTLICRYRNGSPFVTMVYKYGYEFDNSHLTQEKLDASGKAVPVKIDGFRMKHFEGGVLPIGTHIVVTGRRKKA